MPKESPLKLIGWTDELGKGFSAHVETDKSIHTKLNDEYMGFELWTHEIKTEEGARQTAGEFVAICMRSASVMNHEITWR